MQLRDRLMQGEPLAGTFLKTPEHLLVEVLAASGLDFICLDAEHSPFDRGRMDACLAMARALDFPALVRVPAGRPEIILGVLDSGATGIVVPHVDSVAKAEEVARAARFGHGGRGFAGTTRWAGVLGAPMADLLERSRKETIVMAQIEEPEGVDAANDIAAVDGIDALFIGPADLSVAYGKTNVDSPELHAAYKTVGEACKTHGKGFVTWAPDVAKMKDWHPYGVNCFFIASELGWVLSGARTVVADIKALSPD
ncbi:HpcH/HpaI aldolase/citrate lyase family protein [Actibacterium sp. 188UL27-1]|uniref:HpcH/HpaI aldolase family protein n=1 Tax=Actibacterium sp. 188UL27-1 TaxID=2786961 RepID=UPI00195D1725|nr:aldolase/citrate lyase family protein [Actibacterium sp. 188UL27-1]MBM7066609.1 aldolase [Actibacterium sp. 188UL27-1]